MRATGLPRHRESQQAGELWDIVNQFKATDFCMRAGNLAILEAAFCHANPAKVEEWAQLCMNFGGQIRHAANECHDIGLTDAWSEIDRVNSSSGLHPNEPSAQAAAASHIRHCIVAALGKRKFLYVRAEYTEYVDQDSLFGNQVELSFRNAGFDIRETGNCLAAECPTAAVFHLMRAVEWGLRALATDLGRKRLRCINKKTGAVKYTPLPWATWDDIIRDIKTRIADRISKTKRGPAKQEYQEFYNPMVDHIERFKDAYRNHVMHTRREYTVPEAFAVFDQVRHFMARLAERVSEC